MARNQAPAAETANSPMKTADGYDLLYTREAAARIFQVDVKTIIRWESAGILTSRKYGSKLIRITGESISRLVQRGA
jgi:hypothetical protein